MISARTVWVLLISSDSSTLERVQCTWHHCLSVFSCVTEQVYDLTQPHPKCNALNKERGHWKDAFQKHIKLNFNTGLTEVCVLILHASEGPICSTALSSIKPRARPCVPQKGWELGMRPWWYSVDPADQNFRTHILLLHFLFLSHKSWAH